MIFNKNGKKRWELLNHGVERKQSGQFNERSPLCKLINEVVESQRSTMFFACTNNTYEIR